MLRHSLIGTLILIVFCGGAVAADWTWPEQMTIAGFSVTNIRGSVNPNGTGTATGTVRVPGVATGVPANLTRSAGGDVSATCAVNLRVDGAEVQGTGSLGRSGFRVTGSVQGSVKTISEADLSVQADGRFQGSGCVSLSALVVPVNVTVSAAGFVFRGSAPVQAQCDRDLALYKFDGILTVEGGAGRLVLTASGTVERKGKLADQVTTHTVSGIPVNLSDGTGPADIGGVKLRFKFF